MQTKLPKLGTRNTQLQCLKKNHSKTPFKGEFSPETKDQHEKGHPTSVISYHKSSKTESFSQVLGF